MVSIPYRYCSRGCIISLINRNRLEGFERLGANILTTKECIVKLVDFGVSMKLSEAEGNTHSVTGTPYWMAPEDENPPIPDNL
ncbi:hypothetical protein L1987_02030 [Smallanthus sonchifolius]|uniref:Uncharacterized protein n=1 Tax=Smallanthus sonchifolius TaxID=185202 RepID=A0ACB9K6K0_9ASTR|nr:hypothetical protein L1987_02030 [Smallanthus sonchifolius]